MPSVGTASIDLIVDKQQFGRSIHGAVDGSGGIFKSAGAKFAGIFAGGFAALGAAGLFKDAIDGARDLAENQSKVNTVFRDAGPAISEFAKGADAIGLTDNAALQALGTFGNMFDQLKIGSKESAKMSTGMVSLAADLGSFHNADITDVIDSMTSAFRGEYDAVQRFIPTINAANVEQRALADTGKKVAKELTAQEKAIAVNKLLMEGAGAAAGDFSRTSGGLANQQRVLGARWEELKTSLGKGLLPVITTVTAFFAKNLPGAFSATAKAVAPLKNMFANLIAGFKGGESEFVSGFDEAFYKIGQTLKNDVLPVLRMAADWMRNNWKTALAIAGAAFLLFTGPITFVVVSLALLYTKFQGVRDFIGAAIGFIGEQFGKFLGWAKSIFPQVKEAIGHFVSAVKTIWGVWGDDLIRIAKTMWNYVQETIENALQVIKGIIKFVLAVINGDWGKAWEALKSIVGGVWDQIGNVISTAFGVIRGLFGGFGDTISSIWSGLWGGLKGVVDSVWLGIQSSVRDGVNFIIEGINKLVRALNLLKPGKDIGAIGKLSMVERGGFDWGSYQPDQFFADGGFVKGAPGSPQLVMAHAGEYVLSNKDVASLRNGGGGMAGVTVVVQNAVVGNNAQLAAYLKDVLTRDLRNGGAPAPLGSA